jgi:septal ring factor EnvC (AmiA/AmiB activator)
VGQAAALACVLSLACAPATAGDETQAAERELSRISATITALEREMRAAEADRGEASLALERHERTIAAIAVEQRRLGVAARALDGELTRLGAARASIGGEVRTQRRALSRLLRQGYALGRQHPVRLLLQERNPATVARLLRYQAHLARERRARIAALDGASARLAATERAIDVESRRLARLHAEREARREALLAERARRAATLERLERELGEHASALGALRADRERLRALVQRLREAIDDVPAELEPPRSFRTLRGKLPWPVRGAVARRFGEKRDEAGLAWQGVVLEAPGGGEVRAVAHGRVVFADWLRGFGMMVILEGTTRACSASRGSGSRRATPSPPWATAEATRAPASTSRSATTGTPRIRPAGAACGPGSGLPCKPRRAASKLRRCRPRRVGRPGSPRVGGRAASFAGRLRPPRYGLRWAWDARRHS